ncbi:MAG: hypothetical protein ATN35_09605 [Epulopiscium sp. Nele67-Bin004]|nr:MAG: hypothetical protein ATN35_09605 [Epulopiscium sp. Nele67-Bin004]
MQVEIQDIYRRLDTVKEELYLDAVADNAKKRMVKRGQVYKCKFSSGVGSEQNKERPCVILQNDDANRRSGNTIVAPITHTASTLPTVLQIDTQKDDNNEIILDGYVLVSNIVTVSKVRLGDYIGTLSKKDMNKIDEIIPLAINKQYHIKQKNLMKDKENHIDRLKLRAENIESELVEFKQIMEEFGIENIPDLKKILEIHCKL